MGKQENVSLMKQNPAFFIPPMGVFYKNGIGKAK
ncbi:YqaE/Pmp3 family membrane protein [Ihubacter massiliensis]|uniref:YqaE/Pmp3 family membrane protein n=1 Tax=Hominibacterium faecale TaxID=2839743 RepID=A0A9J6QYY9_9FIRM|nr:MULTISPECIES: YqaE/Pmp3 family membrane protein [Eubacteriales Family XIII. Incertae Sedis]MCI7301161.1 YqaE/Pmp3 family membrane protein [Clostridia bacterium]MDE8735163.1 YqaE/Pmp3 family membrane protein [Eubacteriales bacterium DFI.9.88]MDY3012305.1 YqaE/Pmp3 family membrane protein [Clostridiales Family XIII bacterium]MCO7123592.1 YqaE/Pmp3 family membrane protein [Ihubacter massiliensis]MCU7380688.1 YqaE/Pmp3 family membrane protein [Hominibacterium faecale]